MLKKPAFWLVILFLLCLGLRLYFSLPAESFSDDESYSVLRQVDHIKQTGMPFLQDDLLYDSKPTLFLPGYFYLLASSSYLIPPGLAFKIVPNLLAALVVFFAYLSSSMITKNRIANIMVALVAGFNPLFFKSTVNSLSADSIVAPLLLILVYLFLKIPQDESKANAYLLVFVTLLFISPLTIIFLLGGGLFFLLLKLEKIPVKRSHTEILLFSFLLYAWSVLIIFKRPFLEHGARVIWQNVPVALTGEFFRQVSALEMVSLIGILPLFAGSYALYRTLFDRKNRHALLIAGLLIGLLFLLVFRLIRDDTGVTYFALIFTMLFGEFIGLLDGWFKKTKFAVHRGLMLGVLLVLSVFSSAVPAAVYAAEEQESGPTVKEQGAYQWLREKADPDTTVLVPLGQASIVQREAGKTVLLTEQFLSIQDTDKRYEDIAAIYRAIYKTNAIALLTKYDIDYLIWSPRIAEEMGVERLAFIDERCFSLVFDDVVQVYRVRCRIGDTGDAREG